MSSILVCAGLVVAIIAVLVRHAVKIIRAERGKPLGSAPGRGFHEIDASYHSGGTGGGETFRFRVPADPQDYAKIFLQKRRWLPGTDNAPGATGTSAARPLDRVSTEDHN